MRAAGLGAQRRAIHCSTCRVRSAAVRSSSRWSRPSGLCASSPWRRLRWKRCAMGASASSRSASPRCTYNWLENIQDWCISRQLWWGHRIPVWYCAGLRRDDRRAPGSGSLLPLRQRPHQPGSGCAGYLVLLRAVAFLHAGLAGRDARPDSISTPPPSWKPVTTSCSSGWRA